MGKKILGLFFDLFEVFVFRDLAYFIGAEPDDGAHDVFLELACDEIHDVLGFGTFDRVKIEFQKTVFQRVAFRGGIRYGEHHFGVDAEGLDRIPSGDFPLTVMDPVGHRVPFAKPGDHGYGGVFFRGGIRSRGFALFVLRERGEPAQKDEQQATHGQDGE